MLLTDAQRVLYQEYVINERKSLDRVKVVFAHLSDHFGGLHRKVEEITTEALLGYASARLQKVTRGTVWYELRIIRHSFRLLLSYGLLQAVPRFPQLSPASPRQGFVEDHEMELIARELRPEVAPAAWFLFWTGWRLQEALDLTWAKNVDRERELLRLEPGTTKCGEGRVWPYGRLPPLKRILDRQWELKSIFEADLKRVIPTVFFRFSHGTPLIAIRKGWRAACVRAGLPGKIIHDLRRTAVRRLERAGVPRKVAMQLTGHRTERVYQAYHIVQERDLGDGVARLADFVADSQKSTKPGHIVQHPGAGELA